MINHHFVLFLGVTALTARQSTASRVRVPLFSLHEQPMCKTHNVYGYFALAALFLQLFASVTAQQTISIDTTTVVRASAYPYIGLNVDICWDTKVYSAPSATALKSAGTRMLRWPGGAPALWYNWSNMTSMWGINWCLRGTGMPTTNIDDFLAYCDVVSAEPMIQINTAWNNTYFQDFLTYLQQKGRVINYWEMGNEQDMTSTGGTGNGFNQAYMTSFNRLAAVLHQMLPSAKVFGPVSTNVWFWMNQNDLDPVLNQTGNRYGNGSLDGVSIHWYPAPDCNGKTSDQIAAAMFTNVWDWVRWNATGYLRDRIARYDTRDLPIFLSEMSAGGSYSCNNSKQVASALANSDAYGVLREGTIDAVQMFGNPHDISGFGILDQTTEAPYSTYYSLLLWSKMGQNVLKVTGYTDSTKLNAFASKTTNEAIQVIINNKQAASQDVTVSGFSMSGYNVSTWTLNSQAPTDSCWQTAYLFNGISSASLTAQSAVPAPTTSAVTSSPYVVSVPGCSITLLEFSLNVVATTPVVSVTTPLSTTPSSSSVKPTTTLPTTPSGSTSTSTSTSTAQTTTQLPPPDTSFSPGTTLPISPLPTPTTSTSPSPVPHKNHFPVWAIVLIIILCVVIVAAAAAGVAFYFHRKRLRGVSTGDNYDLMIS